MSALKYRADIDGLRAIAVLSVIAAHAHAPLVRGGFLGVDVFFVISGYLITAILVREMGQGSFSLARFYERRARRILPALLAVLLVSTPFAMWLMLPDFLQNFGQSVVATLLFSNNLLLAWTSGYWEVESAFKPLLHTWSLGVEEQFYFAYPLLLLLLLRLRANSVALIIAALAAASLVWSEISWRIFPLASFYLPVTRAWELLAGCLVALLPRKDEAAPQWVTLAALVALCAAMAIFDETTPSPSIYSAVPVIAAAVLIHFNRPGHLAYRILSARALVGIGLISYSAYLWHQPLFVFARIYSPEPLGGGIYALLAAVTLAVAYLSWRFIEEPFRRQERMPGKTFIAITAPLTLLLLGAGLAFHFTNGFPRWTYPKLENSEIDAAAYNEAAFRFCRDSFPANGRPNVLIIGNSYARDVINVLKETDALDGKNLAYASVDGACDRVSLTKGDRGGAALVGSADLVLYAMNAGLEELGPVREELVRRGATSFVFWGPKSFGENVMPMARVPLEKREDALSRVPETVVQDNDELAGHLPASQYLDQLRLLGPDGKRVHYFNADGNPLTPDRAHLTQYGARFLARRLVAERPPGFETIRRVERR